MVLRDHSGNSVYVLQICVLLAKYYSGHQIENNEIKRACSTYEGEDRCIRGFVGKPEGKKPLGRPRRRW